MQLFISLLSVLLAVSAQLTVPFGCHLQIGVCLSELAEERGYTGHGPDIWTYMYSGSQGNAVCRDAIRPYLTNPPFLAVSKETGDLLVACLAAI